MSAARTTTVGVILGLLCSQAGAMDLDYQVKMRVAGVSDDRSDLGLSNAGDSLRGYLDVTPWAHLQFSPDWGAFVRGRAFVPTGHVVSAPGENNSNQSSGSFAGLQSLWIDYGGLTTYPGEKLRLGRQRIRQDDAEWWDQDADALRWLLDTTLVQADVGVATQFSDYRTDNIGVPPAQKDRVYGFGSFGGEWAPGQRIGLRVVHAADQVSLPDEGSTVDGRTKLQDARLTWIGLHADHGFFDRLGGPPVAYWCQATWLTGNQSVAEVDGSNVVRSRVAHGVSAAEGEVAARWRLPLPRFPLQIGGAYVYSEGGGEDGYAHQFQQTGMQSDYSRFTGTPSSIYRFNDALRAQLGNLQVVSGFISLNLENYDASAVVHHFRRLDGNAPIVTDGISVAPTTDSKDVGTGADLILTRFLRRQKPAVRGRRYLDGDDDDTRASVQLRAAVFEPGQAYGPEASARYRIYLEGTLWF